MKRNITVFISISCILVVIGFTIYAHNMRPGSQKPQVKAAQIHITLTPTQIILPTASPSATVIPTKTVVKITPTMTEKVIGAWYWKADLKKSQRYIGFDKEGKEVWVDTGDPTPTPTNKPQRNNNLSSPGYIQSKVSEISRPSNKVVVESSPN